MSTTLKRNRNNYQVGQRVSLKTDPSWQGSILPWPAGASSPPGARGLPVFGARNGQLFIRWHDGKTEPRVIDQLEIYPSLPCSDIESASTHPYSVSSARSKNRFQSCQDLRHLRRFQHYIY